MSAEFSTIKAPPRTLDSMDEWGSLDGLLWSLDSGVWNAAGLYELRGASASATAGGSASTSRTRTSRLSVGARLLGGLSGSAVFSLEARGTAQAHEEELGGVTVSLPVAPSQARSGADMEALRLRPGAGEGAALAFQEQQYRRVRTTSTDGSGARTDQHAAACRVRVVGTAAGAAETAEGLAAGYKGWNWQAQPGAAETVWRGAVEWR